MVPDHAVERPLNTQLPAAPRRRLARGERRDQILAAAVTAFGGTGFAGTTTDQIARLAGVTQPYVIRIFETKRQLFLVALQHAADRIDAALHEAARTDATLPGLGRAYHAMIGKQELMILLQGFAAATDPVIGDRARSCFGQLYTTVGNLTGADAGQIRDFLGRGVLTACLAAIRPSGPNGPETPSWMADLLHSEIPAGTVTQTRRPRSAG
jgi:AcrR family transcriptional regulator